MPENWNKNLENWNLFASLYHNYYMRIFND